MRDEFVPTSQLYDVERRTLIAHPAYQATDADARCALTDGRTVEPPTDSANPPHTVETPAESGESSTGSLLVPLFGIRFF